jgi:hypothetical protein
MRLGGALLGLVGDYNAMLSVIHAIVLGTYVGVGAGRLYLGTMLVSYLPINDRYSPHHHHHMAQLQDVEYGVKWWNIRVFSLQLHTCMCSLYHNSLIESNRLSLE